MPLWNGIGEIRELPSVLAVPVLFPCLETEKLCIAVDVIKGSFIASLAQKGELFLHIRIISSACYMLI